METSRRSSLSDSSNLGKVHRSILKRDEESFIDVRDDLDRAMASASSETPEQWFQRILSTHKLSPLDLCDRFCFGDARQHRQVALKHVCKVLFEVEAHGCDPMTDAMEEFLYRFSFDGGDGEIVVDIKEALRTLDIWKTTGSGLSPSPRSSPTATVSPAKAAMLEVKAEKLKKVIDSLQQENLRLSQALRSANERESSSLTGASDETRPPSPLRIAIKKPPQVAAAGSLSAAPRPSSPSKQQQTPQMVVSRHERDLIAMANQLEYTGVKCLEALLQKDDKTAAGFVSLKQLRYLLAHECRLGNEVSESKLMELCLGMNFNAQGQLDYKEFVRVLLDILVYEQTPPRRSACSGDSGVSSRLSLSEGDAALLGKIREYLRGFAGSRETTRALLYGLCDKHDLEGNQCLSLIEMIKAVHTDLPSQHPVKLKCPLTQTETKTLMLSLAATSGHPTTATPNGEAKETAFVFYPAILDALFRVETPTRHATERDAVLTRVLSPEFWTSLRSALCPHDNNPSLARKIHSQVCKILSKLDPKQRFLLAQRHFVRVFDQHWSTRDMEVLVEVLSHPLEGCGPPSDGAVYVRYDILMRVLFGAPELRDASALTHITTALQRDCSRSSTSWRVKLREMTSASSHHKKDRAKTLTYSQVYELLCGHETLTINVTEFLYLVAYVQDDSRRVDAHKLWTLLEGGTQRPKEAKKQSASAKADSQSFTLLRQCLRELYSEHGLEEAVARRCRHERGVVSVNDLAAELGCQLRVLKLSSEENGQVSSDQIHSFLASLTRSSDGSASASASASPGVGLLNSHALMDAVFDWDQVTAALCLPDRLVDVKKTLELFDWDHDGSIDADDWAKAWRQLTCHRRLGKQTPQPLYDWEIRVLVRRFPAGPSATRSRRSAHGLGAIEYSRLLVFLLERHQRLARDQLQAAVLLLLTQLCARVTQGKPHVSTFHLEKAFEAIDCESKGYFHLGDLRSFVLDGLRQAREAGMEVEALEAYARQGPALEAVMAFLIGDKESQRIKDGRKKVVSLMRFQELMNHNFFQSTPFSVQRHHRSHKTHRTSGEERGNNTSSTEEFSHADPDLDPDQHDSPQFEGQITLLRDLELCIFEIAKQWLDANGQLSPSAAYAHLNGSTSTTKPPSHRRPRSQSPVRSARPAAASFRASYSSSSSSSQSRRASCTPRTLAESAAHDPLTVSRLKHTLRTQHGMETSTHLLSQFFLRLGAPTKHFLDLSLFAKWLVPLSIEMHARVKQIVREMLVKSKAGGGHVDLERFIGAIERRLVDAQVQDEARMGRLQSGDNDRDGCVRMVRPKELLTRLHQLNVSIRTGELTQLLRHFGMDDQLEVDVGVVIRRIYELGQQLPVHGDR